MNDPSLLHRLQGEELSSVIFVKDYLQLDFAGPRLTCLAWPVLTIEGAEFTVEAAGYRDRLCSYIGETVTAVQVDAAVGLLLRFGHKSLRIRPRIDDLEGPEIALLQLPDGEWDVWRPGEGVFTSLA